MNEKYLKEAFDLFDVDSNGFITPSELKHILSKGTMAINIADESESQDSKWEDIIKEFDKNGDG